MEHLVVMGVSGTGKSTVGRLVAEQLGRPFVEGDELHPAANIDKMRAGIPLTDDDRGPWLRAVRDAMDDAGGPTVVACSALRRSYRDILRTADGRVRFALLVATPEELARRLAARPGHFMPPSLLASQLATLEPLAPDEDGITVRSDDDPVATATAAAQALTENPQRPHP
ncbi:gluconokinase [Cellulomonas sp. McL0617]|uniref:gluconokinase n=1 Tax=Cellulomonas sp. McL0617 TaxID=3415675 RepID=UPI003CFAE26F